MSKQLTIKKALEITFEKLGEIKEKGIEVNMTPSRSRSIEDTVEKYGNKPRRLKPSYWFHTEFKVNDGDESDEIYKAACELGDLGIGFDTGGCSGIRDWELDWSFHTNDPSKYNSNAGKDVVEDMLTEIEFSTTLDAALNNTEGENFPTGNGLSD